MTLATPEDERAARARRGAHLNYLRDLGWAPVRLAALRMELLESGAVAAMTAAESLAYAQLRMWYASGERPVGTWTPRPSAKAIGQAREREIARARTQAARARRAEYAMARRGRG